MHRLGDRAAAGRMNAVIVTGAEVKCQKGATVIAARFALVREQSGGAVIASLRLQQSSALDVPQLSNHAIHGRARRVGGREPWSRAGLKFAYKKFVERGIILQRAFGFGDVDADSAGKTAQHRFSHGSRQWCVGDAAEAAAQRTLRQPFERGENRAPAS